MRSPLAAIFDEALNNCFREAVEAILGRPVRDEIYLVLERRGITMLEVSSRFDDVVEVLTEIFGRSSRVLVHKTLAELYRHYSQRIDFSYEDSLKYHLSILKERVITDHLYPKKVQSDASFLDARKHTNQNLNTSTEAGSSWSSFYRLKKGVGSDSR